MFLLSDCAGKRFLVVNTTAFDVNKTDLLLSVEHVSNILAGLKKHSDTKAA